MARNRGNIQNKSSDNSFSRGKACSFKINEGVFLRMEKHVESKFSRVKSKTDLVETAIVEFLNREEPIAKKLEEVRQRLERGFEL